MLGAARRRCRVHFVRDVFAVIPKGSAEMVAATIRTVFAQPTADAVRTQLNTAADMLDRQFAEVREMLLEAKEGVTAFADFPHQHWKKIQSTNPLERLNRKIKRRTDVVQVFPDPTAVLRLATAVLTELYESGLPSPAATSPPKTWTPSTATTRSSYPPHQTTDRLHHDKKHDHWLRDPRQVSVGTCAYTSPVDAIPMSPPAAMDRPPAAVAPPGAAGVAVGIAGGTAGAAPSPVVAMPMLPPAAIDRSPVALTDGDLLGVNAKWAYRARPRPMSPAAPPPTLAHGSAASTSMVAPMTNATAPTPHSPIPAYISAFMPSSSPLGVPLYVFLGLQTSVDRVGLSVR
ncbi:Transposase, Mutator family [Streptomyces sp. PTY087I2]|nr:Transposase, Mutator family [Streptomyces sp. PTY087I2]